MASLSDLKPNKGANSKRKRVGRGHGSGTGTNAGRGQKGQKHRTGHHGAIIGFEGGQMPIQRRLPKRGFTNPFRVETSAINVGALAERFPDAGEITLEMLVSSGLIPRKSRRVKVLGEGDVGHALTIHAHAFSASAREKLEKAGGSATVVDSRPRPRTEAAAGETATE